MEEKIAHKECEVCEVRAEVKAVRVSDGEAVAALVRWTDDGHTRSPHIPSFATES